MNQIVPFAAPAMTVSDVERVALAIAKGGLFGSKDPNAVLTLCLLAQAEGQHPAVVFRDYHIINGKPAKKAEAMLRDFIQAGGKIEWHTLTDELADATFSHPQGGTARITWDHARATKAQIAGNGMYKKFPRQMLRSRVISEGVRTIYPGATSGLYEADEVRTFDDVAAPVSGTEHDAPSGEYDPRTGEIIEAEAEPVKVTGIHKIKERLRALLNVGNADVSLEKFNALVHDAKDDLTKIKEANHSWWTGDGEDFEGFRAWIKRRREELAEPAEDGMYAMLIKSMKECETLIQLANWMATNEALIGGLDGAESRRFQLAYELHESAIQAMDTVSA